MWESLSRGMQIIVITGLFSVIALVGGAVIVHFQNKKRSDGTDEG